MLVSPIPGVCGAYLDVLSPRQCNDNGSTVLCLGMCVPEALPRANREDTQIDKSKKPLLHLFRWNSAANLHYAIVTGGDQQAEVRGERHAADRAGVFREGVAGQAAPIGK